MSKAKMNKFNKALQSYLASEKKHDFEAMLEWELILIIKEAKYIIKKN